MSKCIYTENMSGDIFRHNRITRWRSLVDLFKRKKQRKSQKIKKKIAKTNPILYYNQAKQNINDNINK